MSENITLIISDNENPIEISITEAPPIYVTFLDIATVDPRVEEAKNVAVQAAAQAVAALESVNGLLGAGGLPLGGDIGDALQKTSELPGESEWVSMNYVGFSSRWSQAVNLLGLKAVTDFLIGISYAPHTVSFSATASGTLREKGTVVTAATLTANVTKKSNPIARIRFFQGGSLLEDNNPPGNIGSGATSYSWTGSFSDNTTFSSQVTDTVVGADGGSNVTSTATFSFVYPYYHGCRAPSATASQVAALTKSVINSTATLGRSFTSLDGDVYYIAYPASYGALTSILDENNFETIGDWKLTTSNITGLDASAVSYRIYEFKNTVVAGSTTYTFKR